MIAADAWKPTDIIVVRRDDGAEQLAVYVTSRGGGMHEVQRVAGNVRAAGNARAPTKPWRVCDGEIRRRAEPEEIRSGVPLS